MDDAWLCCRRTIDPAGPFIQLLQSRFVRHGPKDAREVQPTPAGALEVISTICTVWNRCQGTRCLLSACNVTLPSSHSPHRARIIHTMCELLFILNLTIVCRCCRQPHMCTSQPAASTRALCTPMSTRCESPALAAADASPSCCTQGNGEAVGSSANAATSIDLLTPKVHWTWRSPSQPSTRSCGRPAGGAYLPPQTPGSLRCGPAPPASRLRACCRRG